MGSPERMQRVGSCTYRGSLSADLYLKRKGFFTKAARRDRERPRRKEMLTQRGKKPTLVFALQTTNVHEKEIQPFA